MGVGVWWIGAGENNAWFGKGPQESWTVLTTMPDSSIQYNGALQLILNAMPTMARAAENIARATGAPFLESHFFVGNTKWGIRLNKVTCCSNMELRRVADNPRGYVNDSWAIAR